MKFNVIAISRTLGAGGEDLGELIAKDLGFRYVDGEILDRAAAQAGVSTTEVARTEARKGLMARILENLAKAGTGSMAASGLPEPILEIDTPSYESLIVDVIRETADQGQVVIVAHGASIPLAGRPGLLRVMVTASAETRAQRVHESTGEPLAKAQKDVQDSDKGRADYFHRFYGVEHEQSTHYDIVINTDVLSVDHAASLILALAHM
jgi:cytidylate kinase